MVLPTVTRIMEIGAKTPFCVLNSILRFIAATKGTEQDTRLRDDLVDRPYDQRLSILINTTRNINI
jgi:hypothetical protein